MTKGDFQIRRCETEGVEAIWADTAHAFSRHTHDQFGIGLMLRGAQKSMSGRGMVEAEAGDIITVNPGEVHDGSPLGEHGRTWRMLYFDPPILTGLIRALAEGDAELAHPVMRERAMATRFLSLFRAMTSPQGGDSEIEGRENLLLLLARLVDLPRRERSVETPKGIDHARARIDDDPATPLSLAELAVIGGVSQFQLVRGFSRATGLTPHAYLVQRRLEMARKLIKADTPLAATAQSCGFADQSHMTRLFVRAYGMSPGLYAAART